MTWYRAYHLQDDHIVAARDFEAGSDLQALELARLWADGSEVETWSGSRIVGSIHSAAAAAAKR
jgi:hypothetical protein